MVGSAVFVNVQLVEIQFLAVVSLSFVRYKPDVHHQRKIQPPGQNAGQARRSIYLGWFDSFNHGLYFSSAVIFKLNINLIQIGFD
jgi:hypothetical protein